MMHLYKNQDNENIKDLDYIGFCQYDMRLSPDIFQDMEKWITERPNKLIIFCDKTEPGQYVTYTVYGLCLPYENSILRHYNEFFGTSYTHLDIDVDIPLLHTFVMPVATFLKMMCWMNVLMPLIDEHFTLITDRSQAEFVEKIHGLFLSLEIKKINGLFVPLKLQHIWPLYHNQTEWRNYKKII